MKAKEQTEIIKFIRKKDYKFIRELGEGACGKTILLFDDQINEYFVCKKFTPYAESERLSLFNNFTRETKILHQLYHDNLVRVFNYYLYPDSLIGYILMEYIDGVDIETYLKSYPEMINEVFIQVIDGFKYLENNNILHRDIRSANLMVNNLGIPKIIDFGFGKQISDNDDFGKSVSLNWWCELPNEFSESIYDFKTEVYFVGKLFERIIREGGIENFKYLSTLNRMCIRNPDKRVQNFSEITKTIQNNLFLEIEFSENELNSYREFADSIENHILKIEQGTKYVDDTGKILSSLENAYRNFMLEQIVPDSRVVAKCLLNGSYFYHKKGFPVEAVKSFIHMMKSLSIDKQRIVMSNLHTRLDAIERYFEDDNDEIPF